jgi:hypothetical protein
VSTLEATLRRVLGDVERAGVGCAIVGGLAVSARTEPRFTRDVDLAVAVTDDVTAEKLVRELVAAGYRAGATVEQEAVGRLAGVRLDAPGEGGVVDLLFAASGIEPEVVASAERLELLPGLMAPVARVGHLVALKLLARDDELRPLDAVDLAALRAVADAEERRLADAAVGLITERGFARGRDLRAALEELFGAPR